MLKVPIITMKGAPHDASNHATEPRGSGIGPSSAPCRADKRASTQLHSPQSGAGRGNSKLSPDDSDPRTDRGDGSIGGAGSKEDEGSLPIADSLVADARYTDIARRLLMQESVADIAMEMGYSERHIRRLLKKPEMIRAYRDARDTMIEQLDEVIKNEKLAPLFRARAQSIRAQTILSEVLDELQSRIKDGNAKATEMRVAADTAFGIIDRAKTAISNAAGGSGGSTEVNVSLSLGADQKTILKNTINEAGLDLSDIIDAEIVNEKPNEPASEV